MKTFSIVCVYNNKEILRKYLLKSLKKQTESYELILIDNTNKQFSSVAEGLNAGGKKSKGEVYNVCSSRCRFDFRNMVNEG